MNADRELILYNRYGCHLCEDMLASLNDYAGELKFTVTLVDIDNSPTLQTRYNEAVPVLQFRDREVCRHFLDLHALRKALSAGSGAHHQVN